MSEPDTLADRFDRLEKKLDDSLERSARNEVKLDLALTRDADKEVRLRLIEHRFWLALGGVGSLAVFKEQIFKALHL
jgi:hypothetical protein